MRHNQPVTDQEYEIRDDQNLISRTDMQGRITYASPTFVEVSGFSREELIGSPHNVIRHPDMPEAAFANLWQTLEAGEIWSGLVKNRRKNGDFYWVHAHVVPILEEGEIQGFTSVRVKPAPGAKERAEAVYRRLREGRGRGIRLVRGEIRQGGVLGRLAGLRLGGVQVIIALMASTALLAILGAGAIGWPGQLLGGLAVVAMAAYSTTRLDGALKRARRFAMQVAAGNLAAKPPKVNGDGMGEVVTALAIMQRSLANISLDIHHTLGIVERETGELERDNRELAARTHRQSASLQQTAASMEELTATVHQNAGNTEQAEREAERAHRAVGESDQDVGRLVASMQQIASSAGKMTQAIDAIESLAFQTNLLALNASVEAARAGVHGRGFAVVAQEVRRLAESSAESADHVRRLIDGTLADVRDGEQRIEQLEANNRGVVEAVASIGGLIREIATASREQAVGLEQINEAVVQMDTVTRETAEQVSHSASLGTLLAAQVETLTVAISALRQGGNGKEWVDRQQRFAARRALAADQPAAQPPALADPATESTC